MFQEKDLWKSDQINYTNSFIKSPLIWVAICCLPFGIVSIIYAIQVNTLLVGGAYKEALEATNNTKMWAWTGFGIGLVLWIILGLFTTLLFRLFG